MGIFWGLESNQRMTDIIGMRKYFNDIIATKIRQFISKGDRTTNVIFLPGGVSRDSRVQWPFECYDRWCKKNPSVDVVKTIESAFPNGLVVVLRNSDYFDVKESAVPHHQLVYSRLGSDKLMASVWAIIKKDSGKTNLDDLVTRMSQIPDIKPLSSVNPMMSYTSKKRPSNSYWEGHYAKKIVGGSNTSIEEGLIPLGNYIYDYASEEDTKSIELQLMFMMLHCENAEKLLNDPTKLDEIREKYRTECEKRGLTDWSKFDKAKPIHPSGHLQCFLTCKEITADQFLGNCDDNYKIELCHISAKDEDDVTISPDGHVKTTFRPYNIAWGHKWANRSQNTMTLAEFHKMLNVSNLAIQSQYNYTRETQCLS
jgi:hypothetical protein